MYNLLILVCKEYTLLYLHQMTCTSFKKFKSIFFYTVTGGSANSGSPGPPERPPTFQRDNSQVTTLNELGKKLLAAAKVGNTSQVRRLMAIGAPFASDGVSNNSDFVTGCGKLCLEKGGRGDHLAKT